MSAEILKLTANVVAAYVGKNPVPATLLPSVIADVYAALDRVGEAPTEPAPEKQTPAVNPKRSVFPDYIISLEDGKKYKALKRGLMARHGLTPDQYRQKWGLPNDYPMTAPSYSAVRSELAKAAGLGALKNMPAPKPRGRKAKATKG